MMKRNVLMVSATALAVLWADGTFAGGEGVGVPTKPPVSGPVPGRGPLGEGQVNRPGMGKLPPPIAHDAAPVGNAAPVGGTPGYAAPVPPGGAGQPYTTLGPERGTPNYTTLGPEQATPGNTTSGPQQPSAPVVGRAPPFDPTSRPMPVPPGAGPQAPVARPIGDPARPPTGTGQSPVELAKPTTPSTQSTSSSTSSGEPPPPTSRGNALAERGAYTPGPPRQVEPGASSSTYNRVEGDLTQPTVFDRFLLSGRAFRGTDGDYYSYANGTQVLFNDKTLDIEEMQGGKVANVATHEPIRPALPPRPQSGAGGLPPGPVSRGKAPY
jgi:hypothetical protein